MKIGIFDNLNIGGAKRVVFEQIKGLSEDNEIYWITNTIYDLFDASEYCEDVFELGFDNLNHQGLKRIKNEYELSVGWKNLYKEAVKKFESFGVEVLLIHPDKVTQAPMIMSMTNLPRVYYAHEWMRSVYEPEIHKVVSDKKIKASYELLRRNYLKRIDYKNCRKADRIVCNSEFVKNNLLKAYKREAVVLHPGVDLETFKPKRNIKRSHFLILGAETEIEGTDLLNEVTANSNLPFKINRVNFDGNEFEHSDEKLVELYQQSAATLCFSYNEPFGLAAIESMACETPVIAVDEGGYKETVVDSETGFLIERDADSVVEKMKLLAVDLELVEKMGKAGRKRARTYFSWKKHVTKLEAVLNEVVDEKN